VAKKAVKKSKAKHPAKKASKGTKQPYGAAAMANAPCMIMYRVGAVLRTWIPGQPVTQVMRDVMEKHLPPLTAGERMALEAKRRVHNELAGSVALADATKDNAESLPLPTGEKRRRTTAELLGGPPATEIEGTATKDPEPVKAARVRPQLI